MAAFGHLAWLNTTISPMETLEEKVMLSLSARSHPGRYPEGRRAHGARVRRRQNGKTFSGVNYMGEGGGHRVRLPYLHHSPRHKGEARPTAHVQTCVGRSWSYSLEEAPGTSCNTRRGWGGRMHGPRPTGPRSSSRNIELLQACSTSSNT